MHLDKILFSLNLISVKRRILFLRTRFLSLASRRAFLVAVLSLAKPFIKRPSFYGFCNQVGYGGRLHRAEKIYLRMSRHKA